MWFVLAGLTVAGGILRFQAASTDLWFDELWSLEHVLAYTGVWDVFTHKHDNNHLLNSLWLYALGDRDEWILYRIPSLVTGTLVVLLLGWLGWQRGRAHGVFAGLLAAGSLPLVQYSSEARGYGPAMFATVASFALLDRYLCCRTKRWAIGAGLCMLLGFLAHYSFLFPGAAMVIWVGMVAWCRSNSLGATVRDLRRCFALPAIGVLVLFFVNIQGREIGGGPSLPMGVVLRAIVNRSFGISEQDAWGPLLIWPIVALLVFEWIQLSRVRHRWSLLFVALVVVSPIITLVLDPRILHVRYFVVGAPLLLLSGAFVLGRCWQAGLAGRLVSLALVGLVLFGNGRGVHGLITVGRGQYMAGIRYLEQATKTPVIGVGMLPGEQANWLILKYYRRFLGPGRRLVLVRPEYGPPWFVTHSWEPAYRPKPMVIVSGHRYRFQRRFPFSGMSGWSWLFYSRAD